MKKLVLLLALVGIAAMTFAQTNVPTVSGALQIPENSYVKYWGTSADSVNTSDTLSLTLRVRGAGVRTLDFGVFITDSLTGNVYVSRSMDGTTFANTDTLTWANVMTPLYLQKDAFNYPYIRFILISGATDTKPLVPTIYTINRAK